MTEVGPVESGLHQPERPSITISGACSIRVKHDDVHSLIVLLTNSLLRKSPTSSVVDGPPMFMNTIAVGPLEPIESCVTGGATVAILRRCWAAAC